VTVALSDALSRLVPYWGSPDRATATSISMKRHLSRGALALLDHPQAIGHHFDYRKAIPILNMDVEDVYPNGRTALDESFTDLSYMVSQYGAPESAVTAMREGTVAENLNFYPPDLLLSLREKAARKKFDCAHVPGTFEVIGTEGAQGAIGYSFLTFLNPGDEVIITDPGYMHFSSCATAVGAIPVPVALTESNNFRLTAADVERALTSRTKMLVICDPINPFGTVQSNESLVELARLCRDNDVLIFNNTTHSGHQIDQTLTHRTLASMAGTEDVSHVISASGVSKSHGLASVRVGFLGGVPHLVKAVASMRMEITKVHINYIGQLGTLAALDDSEYVRDSTNWLRGNAKLVADCVTRVDGLRQPIQPEYGFSTVIDVSDTGTTAQELCVALFKRRIATIPGDALGEVGATKYLRINFSHRDRTRLERFGDILPEAVREASSGTYRKAVASFFRQQRTRRGDRIAMELADHRM
jgi:aspartate/methionine/tyrosine aminotransferase